MSGEANSIYNSIVSEADLERWTADKAEETLHLEFKSKSSPEDSKPNEFDKGNFSCCLSSFANADGGVLVWGIKTAKRADGTDFADSLVPIFDVNAFCLRLRSSIVEFTHPQVDNVELKTVPSLIGPSGSGYVVCLIPPSERPPHMAKHTKAYWRRNSQTTRRMEHYELEDVFGRRLRPRLKFVIDYAPPQHLQTHDEILISLENHGKGIAKYSGFFCECTSLQVQLGELKSLVNLTGLNGKPVMGWDAKTAVIHCHGMRVHIGSAKIVRPPELSHTPLSFRVLLYAENQEAREFDVSVRSGSVIVAG